MATHAKDLDPRGQPFLLRRRWGITCVYAVHPPELHVTIQCRPVPLRAAF